jgi:predicted GNAT family acetyltransferase
MVENYDTTKTFWYLTRKQAMEIQQEETEREGSFFVKEGQDLLAEMTYKLSASNVMVIEHTVVEYGSRGKGVGYKMLQQAAEYAREQKLRIRPECSFARALFEKKSAEFADIKTN